MPRAISKPGPPATSCVTCRQRRKKCDLCQPRCKRCLKGGYECLGYEDIKSCEKLRNEDPTPPAIPVVSAETARSKFQQVYFLVDELSADQQGPPVLGAALLHRMSAPGSSAINDCAAIDSSKDFDRLWPQEQKQLTVYSRSRAPHSSCAGQSFDISNRNDPCGAVQTPCQSIPRSVDATKIMSDGHALRIIDDYYAYRVRSWFMTPPAQLRNLVTTRFLGSKAIILAMYLGMKLLYAVNQDPSSPAVRGCISRIDNLDQRLTIDSRSNLPLDGLADCLMVQLELALLKFTTVDTASGYIVLQSALPSFLQLVVDDTNLYMECPKSNLVVSFTHALGSTRHEVQRFVTFDAIAGFILGVPPLVEYGYEGECDSSLYGFEWVHGIPVVVIEVISQINSLRAGSKGFPIDWKALETRILAWKLPFIAPDEATNTGCTNMMRFAVQESWRHVVLIYIYMGLCGVSSHDSRVEASVHQIFQLGESIVDLPLSTHMFVQCVIVGLAARLEKHRILVHKVLLSLKDSRAWLFQGPQFGQVLYHLWHGVGEGGAAVTWGDYVQSRCAVMPI